MLNESGMTGGGAMYKKYVTTLLLFGLLLGMAFFQEGAREFVIRLSMYYNPDTECIGCSYQHIEGSRPVLSVHALENSNEILLSESDKQILYRIVEAEAGGEDRIGKILVANVILNRIRSEGFPDTVEEVVYQQNDGVTQFSPIADGSFYRVVPGEDTMDAVNAALLGEDYSNGALYFAARQYADSDKMKWFDDNLEPVVEHGGHEFFK